MRAAAEPEAHLGLVTVNHLAAAGTLAYQLTDDSGYARYVSVLGRTQGKVVAWYDHEWGSFRRLVDLAERILAPVPQAV